jgi:WhiB family redox-sensing transcriptional regulator
VNELGWRSEARCREMSSRVFFGDVGDTFTTAVARRVCSCCAVREECLEYALRNREAFGIWGGTTQLERRELRRAR